MCLGIPMQVLSADSQKALCKRGTEEHWVDLSLIGNVETGEWLLTFMGAAREKISSERAEQINQALKAVALVMQGESADFEALFADLVEREPQLPPHLQELKT